MSKKGIHWPIFVIVMLFFMGAVNGVLIYFAKNEPSELIEENPYEKGLKYSQTMDQLKAFSDLKWKGQVSLVAMDGTKEDLKVTLRNESNMPVTGRALLAELRRPNDATLDKRIELSEREPGEYFAATSRLMSGEWWIDIHVTAPESVMFRDSIRAP